MNLDRGWKVKQLFIWKDQMSLAVCESVGMGQVAEGWQTPKFGLFQQVVVDCSRCDRPQRGWVVGVEYYDPLAHVAATYNGQESPRVKDVEGQSTDGSWEYTVSFQFGLDWTEIGDAAVQETILVSECCLSAAA